jgi:hypothetical protein
MLPMSCKKIRRKTERSSKVHQNDEAPAQSKRDVTLTIPLPSPTNEVVFLEVQNPTRTKDKFEIRILEVFFGVFG